MEYTLLGQVMDPQDLQGMDHRQLELLCGEIRSFLIEKVSQTGGHLSSNLGVIELTVALHYTLHSPQDVLIFDVGHQCYTHKLLTGRRNGFEKLRQQGGISGFPCPAESEHDVFSAGHGSTSLSAAIGVAQAKKLRGEPGLVVAVVGDGALTGGMIYEGLNNVDGLDNLVIILNDNTMSISKNVGALAHYLTSLRTSPSYYRAKQDVKAVLDHTPVIGSGMKRSIQGMKKALRKSLYHSTFFEDMGLRYTGPVDGHDLPALCSLFANLPNMHKPLMIHVETKKGKGFTPAEKNPGAFHATAAFDARHITNPDIAPTNSFSTVFGQKLAKLADEDERICAITAAMKYGTGLQYMKKAHRNRFFDVGMAEEHAVTFAAGLAARGQKPVVAIYSTFLQRAYDQIIHDVMLDGRDVLLAVDRAGLVPGDGQTHQGIYDAAFLSQQPGLLVVSPSNYSELDHWLERLLVKESGPRAIRYPRGKEQPVFAAHPCTGHPFDKIGFKAGRKKTAVALVSYGAQLEPVFQAAELLAEKKQPVDVFKLLVINPLPEGLVEALLGYETVLFAEDGIAHGGIGEHLALGLMKAGFKGRFLHRAVEDIHLDHALPTQLREDCGLDAQSLVAQLEVP